MLDACFELLLAEGRDSATGNALLQSKGGGEFDRLPEPCEVFLSLLHKVNPALCLLSLLWDPACPHLMSVPLKWRMRLLHLAGRHLPSQSALLVGVVGHSWLPLLDATTAFVLQVDSAVPTTGTTPATLQAQYPTLRILQSHLILLAQLQRIMQGADNPLSQDMQKTQQALSAMLQCLTDLLARMWVVGAADALLSLVVDCT